MTDAFLATLKANESTRIQTAISNAAANYGGRCQAVAYHSDRGFYVDLKWKDQNWAAGLNELHIERNQDIAVEGWYGGDGRIGMNNNNANGNFFMGSTWLAIPKEDPRLQCGTTHISYANMYTKRIQFDKPFVEQPKVAVFFRSLKLKQGQTGDMPGGAWRASIRCRNVDRGGFDISLSTNRQDTEADIDWIAHLTADPTIKSGDFHCVLTNCTSPFEYPCDFSDGPMPKSPDIVIRGWSEISVKSGDDLKCKHDQKDVSEKGFNWVMEDFVGNSTETLGGNWVAMMA
ncbi:hypothetical protein FFLO_05976 [Filobasidium floriforme]|uniref:H-type lectin domain-containing protein n=1 Tax=Filobasidium floriforme TaxID=5210 RepID=A0A8K0JFW0_9TREE|nr:hypothetical protein FFLO_05976 [Filobasidium floriforme]